MDTLLEELEKLPLAERMQLVEDLWDSIARSREELPIPQWQKDALEERKRIFCIQQGGCRNGTCNGETSKLTGRGPTC